MRLNRNRPVAGATVWPTLATDREVVALNVEEQIRYGYRLARAGVGEHSDHTIAIDLDILAACSQPAAMLGDQMVTRKWPRIPTRASALQVGITRLCKR